MELTSFYTSFPFTNPEHPNRIQALSIRRPADQPPALRWWVWDWKWGSVAAPSSPPRLHLSLAGVVASPPASVSSMWLIDENNKAACLVVPPEERFVN